MCERCKEKRRSILDDPAALLELVIGPALVVLCACLLFSAGYMAGTEKASWATLRAGWAYLSIVGPDAPAMDVLDAMQKFVETGERPGEQ